MREFWQTQTLASGSRRSGTDNRGPAASNAAGTQF